MEHPRIAHTWWRGRIRDGETKGTRRLGRRRSGGAEQEWAVGLKAYCGGCEAPGKNRDQDEQTMPGGE